MSLRLLKLLLGSLLLLSSCCPHKFVAQENPPPLPSFQVPKKIRVALVLGSGGVRGMVHVGVLEEFEKAGIKFDLIVGCSAGSIVGALYADCPNASYVKEGISRLKRHALLDINLWECRFGLSQGIAMRRMLECYLEAKTFDKLQIPLVIVATDLNTGELVPMGDGDLVKAVRASCAIPLVFVPVEHQGRTLVDGGVVNPVPVCIARDLGADIIIAVDLRELLTHTFPTNLWGVAKRSTEIAFLWQNEACCRGADVVIRPTLRDIGTFDDSKLEMLYEAGRAAAKAAIPHILEIIRPDPCKDAEPILDWTEVSLVPYAPS